MPSVLHKQIGPFPLGVWLIIGAGGVGLTFLGNSRRAKSTAAAQAAATGVPVAGAVDPTQGALDLTGDSSSGSVLDLGQTNALLASIGNTLAGADGPLPVSVVQSVPITTQPLNPTHVGGRDIVLPTAPHTPVKPAAPAKARATFTGGSIFDFAKAHGISATQLLVMNSLPQSTRTIAPGTSLRVEL